MEWRDGYYMYDSITGARTTQNYRITLDMEVKIVEAQIEYTIASYSGYYDNMDHTIDRLAAVNIAHEISVKPSHIIRWRHLIKINHYGKYYSILEEHSMAFLD